MRLPNGERAIIDIRKLRDYCLNAAHPRGQHKARVFRSQLGLGQEHADWLRERLREVAKTEDAQAGAMDAFGQRFVIDFEVAGPLGTAVVRSCWIVRAGEAVPRLTSCFVL